MSSRPDCGKCVKGMNKTGVDEICFCIKQSALFSLLKHHLSAVHARDPVALLKLHEESVSILSSNIQEELALMFKEENICELMKKLDHFQEEIDCTSNVTAWRPSGSPESDICSHLFPVYCKHLQQLENAWHSCSLKIFS
ncbi:hypothetical protein C0Q70_20194 [Pomacea canaliculata]|uniref:Uncharacterized protein n=1 Tax=Pomacea canaliculata TaxID=400727 RepID=A0A2T7NEU5_POMCA|nr:hypothetical protein C0Q70_20194 [Pomacea canaliculata]